MRFVWWNDKWRGARVRHDPPVDVLVKCTCSNGKFFRHQLARTLWPDGINKRTMARSLVCTRCLGKSARIHSWPVRDKNVVGVQVAAPMPDMTMEEIIGWFAYGLHWKALLESGRLPPTRFAAPYGGDVWDIDAIWANGIAGAPPVEEILAKPEAWERSR